MPLTPLFTYLCTMNFTQRFQRFLVGIFIGVILSFFLFGNRNCNKWLPSERVRFMINEKVLRVDANADCLRACYKLDSDWITRTVDAGIVDYGRSEQRQVPQRYFLEDPDDSDSGLMVELRDSASVVINVTIPNAPECDC